jgi:mono/diheme cytochrome c family protein
MKSVLLTIPAVIATLCIAVAQDGTNLTGEQIYEEHCGSCHGERLRSTGAAPDLKLVPADQKDRFDQMVQNGKGQMPAWEGIISDEDREAIWTYIRSRTR